MLNRTIAVQVGASKFFILISYILFTYNILYIFEPKCKQRPNYLCKPVCCCTNHKFVQ